MLDVLVQAEAAVTERHIARVVPVGDIHVVIGQHDCRASETKRLAP